MRNHSFENCSNMKNVYGIVLNAEIRALECVNAVIKPIKKLSSPLGMKCENEILMIPWISKILW